MAEERTRSPRDRGFQLPFLSKDKGKDTDESKDKDKDLGPPAPSCPTGMPPAEWTPQEWFDPGWGTYSDIGKGEDKNENKDKGTDKDTDKGNDKDKDKDKDKDSVAKDSS